MRLQLPLSLALLLCALSVPARAWADASDEQFVRAANHYRQQQWQPAAEAFEAFAAEHPRHAKTASARFFRGECLVQLNRWSDARRQFDAVLADKPEPRFASQALFRRGEAAYVLGDGASAREDLRTFQQRYPDHELNGYALAYLGSLASQAGQAAEAAKLFETALRQFPSGPLVDECRFGLGQARQQLGQLDAAREAYQQLVDSASALASEARVDLATVENSAGAYQAALGWLDRLGNDDDAGLKDRAALARGYAFYKLQRSAEAEAALREIVDRPSLGVEARYWLGLSQAAQSQWTAAAETLLAASQQADNHRLSPALGYHAADALLRAGQLDAAKREFARAIERWPTSAWADDCLLGQIRVAQAQNNHHACIQLADELARRHPTSPLLAQAELIAARAASQQAEAAYSAGEVTQARDAFTRMTRPENAPTVIARGLSGLAWCHFKSGDFQAAADTAGQLVERYPESPLAAEAALLRGRALERLDKPEQALAMYARVYERKPSDALSADALWQAAALHDRLEHADLARQLYGRLVAEHANYKDLDGALYRLAWLEMPRDAQAATTLLTRLRKEFPNSRYAADATLRLAQAAFDGQQFDEAERLLNEATSADMPPEVRAHAQYLQARTAMARGRWSEAEKPLKDLLASQPAEELALAAEYLLAENEYRQGRYEPATEQLKAILAKTADRPQSWSAAAKLRLAQAHAQQSKWAEALEVARPIEAAHPEFAEQAEVDYLIGRALFAQAEFDQARAAWEKTIRAPRAAGSQTQALARWMVGESYFHQENFQAALAEYEKVLDYSFPRWQAAALLQAGKCHEALGRSREAGEAYARLLKEHPESEFAAEARRRSGAGSGRAASSETKIK